MHQVVRAHTCFTCLTFTDWSDFVGLGWLLGRFVCVSFAFLLSTDQPVRSSYQPMTIIAYLHDCHGRYDERSTVQKSEPCGGILTQNGDSYRVSSRRKDLAGTHLPSSRNDSSQISPSGQVMTQKRLCVLTVILLHGRLGILLGTLFGSHVNQAHHWCFQEEEQVISPPYTRTPLDASMRGRKKRKQGEDNALVG